MPLCAECKAECDERTRRREMLDDAIDEQVLEVVTNLGGPERDWVSIPRKRMGDIIRESTDRAMWSLGRLERRGYIEVENTLGKPKYTPCRYRRTAKKLRKR